VCIYVRASQREHRGRYHVCTYVHVQIRRHQRTRADMPYAPQQPWLLVEGGGGVWVWACTMYKWREGHSEKVKGDTLGPSCMLCSGVCWVNPTGVLMCSTLLF